MHNWERFTKDTINEMQVIRPMSRTFIPPQQYEAIVDYFMDDDDGISREKTLKDMFFFNIFDM